LGEAFLMFVMGPEQRQYQIGDGAMDDDNEQQIQAARFHRERFSLTGDCAPLVSVIQRSAMSGAEG
jgi:hypothetical protein